MVLAPLMKDMANRLRVSLGLILAGISLLVATSDPSTAALSHQTRLEQPNMSFEPSVLPTVRPTPVVGVPQTIVIPKVGVTAPVKPVGLLADGILEVPESIHEVGWYTGSVKPGEKGRAILGGHLDSFLSPLGVFSRLRELVPGDEVNIRDVDGQTVSFQVERLERYPTESVPLAEIMNPSDEAGLVLYTCAGSWNWKTKDYSERLVVYASQLIAE